MSIEMVWLGKGQVIRLEDVEVEREDGLLRTSLVGFSILDLDLCIGALHRGYLRVRLSGVFDTIVH